MIDYLETESICAVTSLAALPVKSGGNLDVRSTAAERPRDFVSGPSLPPAPGLCPPTARESGHLPIALAIPQGNIRRTGPSCFDRPRSSLPAL